MKVVHRLKPMCFHELFKVLFPRTQFEDESRQPLLSRTDEYCPDSGMGSSESSPSMITRVNSPIVEERFATPQFTPNLASPDFSQLEAMLRGSISDQERPSTPQFTPDISSPQFSQLETMLRDDIKQWIVETRGFGSSLSPQTVIQEVHEKKSLTNKISSVESIIQNAGNIFDSLDNASKVHQKNEQIATAESKRIIDELTKESMRKIDELTRENDNLRQEMGVRKEEYSEDYSAVSAKNVILESKLKETQEALTEANQLLGFFIEHRGSSMSDVNNSRT